MASTLATFAAPAQFTTRSREAREWLFFTCEDDPADLYARIDALLNKGDNHDQLG
jgi:hypothetical protein